jgi:hypothetical protein
MASQPEKPVVPTDIENLLNLLNASDGAGTANGVSVETIDENAPLKTNSILGLLQSVSTDHVEHRSVADNSETGTSDNGEHAFASDGSYEDDLENRFAAHIVRGMSKLKRE